LSRKYRDRQRQLIDSIRSDVSTVSANASVVPIQADYAADPGRCLTSVMFVPSPKAIALRDGIQEALAQVEPFHYYNPPESMHITIKNVRVAQDPPSFDETDIANVHACFAGVLPHHRSFPFSFEELVVFPNSISLVAYSDERLREVVQALDAGLAEIGLSDDKRYLSDEVFYGNITLCRFTRQPGPRLFEAVTELNRQWHPTSICLSHVELITGNASATPATTTRLHRYELNNM
jgi:2'-5' RNA ligase